jgi:transposase
MKAKKRPDITVERVTKLRGEKLSLSRIAERLGVSISTIRKRLRKTVGSNR